MSEINTEGLQKFFDSMDNSVELNNAVSLSWSLTGFGFGQLYFYEQDGQIWCDNEGMSRETVKKILGIMVDQAKFHHEKKSKEQS